jgi:hypothetical protein
VEEAGEKKDDEDEETESEAGDDGRGDLKEIAKVQLPAICKP